MKRFWDKVQKTTGCWVWTGTKTGGYGRIKIAGSTVLSHRLSWEMANGAIPAGMNVLHRCDNPSCVNPGHLFIGTHAQNMADMKFKGRAYHASQELHPMAKLDSSRAREIFLFANSGHTKASIARNFGITRRVVLQIQRGGLWSSATSSLRS